MRLLIILIGLFIHVSLQAQGCIIGGLPSQPSYVCFDGRTLEKTPTGLIWNAKRGCFLSSIPCCDYNATHYAFQPDPRRLGVAYERCRHDYPFMLGDNQTH